MGLIARFDTRNIRTPNCLARIPFNQLVAAEWGLFHLEMLVWIWKAARKDAGEFPRALPKSEMKPHPDFHGLIFSLRAKSANSTRIASDYDDVAKEFNLPRATRSYPYRANSNSY